MASTTLSPPAINNMCKLHLITRHLGHLQMELHASRLNTLPPDTPIMCYLGREGIMAASLCGNIQHLFASYDLY